VEVVVVVAVVEVPVLVVEVIVVEVVVKVVLVLVDMVVEEVVVVVELDVVEEVEEVDVVFVVLEVVVVVDVGKTTASDALTIDSTSKSGKTCLKATNQPAKPLVSPTSESQNFMFTCQNAGWASLYKVQESL
jgi:hypothetical protein